MELEDDDWEIAFWKLGKKTTVCMITLPNGFDVTGFASCVDMEEFDEAIGREIAQREVLDKISNIQAYLLTEKLYENKGSE